MAKRARRPAFDVRLTDCKDAVLQAYDVYDSARSAILTADIQRLLPKPIQRALWDTFQWLCEHGGSGRRSEVLDYVERAAAVSDMPTFCGYETAHKASKRLVLHLWRLLRRRELQEYDAQELRQLVARTPEINRASTRERILDEYRAALKRFDASRPAPSKTATSSIEGLTLDELALAVYFKHPNWKKKQIAKVLGRPPQSLAPRRCPQLTNAMKAWRNTSDSLGCGSKDKHGGLEAW
jgi:hypothetical protein